MTWPLDRLDDPQTDAEWAFAGWFGMNDPEDATSILWGPTIVWTLPDEFIDEDGWAHILAIEGQPTTPTNVHAPFDQGEPDRWLT